jgi:hypothetical protein
LTWFFGRISIEERSDEVATEGPSTNLSDLHRIAVDEYRFQVSLGWDRTKFYLTLNSALLSVGAALFRPENGTRVLSGAVFVVGIATSVLGARAVADGHRYYRRTVVQKTRIEDALGLLRPVKSSLGPAAPLAISTTTGQLRRLAMLENPDDYVSQPLKRATTISGALSLVLYLLAALNCIGALSAFEPSTTPWIEEFLGRARSWLELWLH